MTGLFKITCNQLEKGGALLHSCECWGDETYKINEFKQEQMFSATLKSSQGQIYTTDLQVYKEK